MARETPKNETPDGRRDPIVAAVWALIARRGLEAVSMREVAREAGVSLGSVQRSFGTKDDLLLAALEDAYRRMEARIDRRVAETRGGDHDLLVAILEELLGGDPETRDAIRINVAFAARALHDERTAALVTEGDEEILGLAVAVCARASANGHLGPGVDPEEEARGLFALATGLGVGVALYGRSPSAARVTLAHHLRRILPPRR